MAVLVEVGPYLSRKGKRKELIRCLMEEDRKEEQEEGDGNKERLWSREKRWMAEKKLEGERGY